MIVAFEDLCRQDTVSAQVVAMSARFKRDIVVRPAPGRFAIDPDELAYEGDPNPVVELAEVRPGCCSEHARKGVKPTQRIFTTECRLGRSWIASKLNLFTLNHTHADVTHVETLVAHLDAAAT